MATTLELNEVSASPAQTKPDAERKAPSLWDDVKEPGQLWRTSLMVIANIIMAAQVLYGMAIKPALDVAAKAKVAATKPADYPPTPKQEPKMAAQVE